MNEAIYGQAALGRVTYDVECTAECIKKKQLLEAEHEKLAFKLAFNNSKSYNNAVIMKHYCNLYYKNLFK